MPAIKFQNPLPIDENISSLLDTIRTHSNVLLHAPPGAGKTTRVPLALLDIFPPEAGRIIMLEPRRLAAVAAAGWMAASLGETVGLTVGYSIRFDSRVTSATRIEVVTEGILTRRIQNDPALEGVAMVIFDEFHERSIHADLGLALCRDVQQQLRPDLKLLIMSATLDIMPLSRLLDGAPLISSAGRAFPVEDIYLDDQPHGKLPQRMAAAIVRALQESEGDILAFLPGSGEIRSCAGLLADAGLTERGVAVHQLYGDLPFAQQQRAIASTDQRKIVLATSIAETSLTIDGVRIVIDSGLSRRVRFDPATGMNRLVTVRESRASAEQRKGRAGRLAPGVCYRLYSRHTFSAMTAHTPPEILETDLSPLLLELAAWGSADFTKLDWLDIPPEPAVAAARRVLAELDAFDDSGRITPLGREIMRLPLHPRLGRLLLRSTELGCPQIGCDLAALLSERDVFRSTRGEMCVQVSHSDVADRLEAFRSWRAGQRSDERLDRTALKNIERVVSQLARLVSCQPVSKQLIYDDDVISGLLLAAYPDRLALRRASGGDSYLLANGRGARLSQRSAVRNAEYIIAVSLDGGSQAEAVIHLAAGVSEEIIRQERNGHIVADSKVSWSDREARVVAVRQERLGAIQLSTEAFIPSDEMAVPAVVQAVRASGLKLLSLDDRLLQFQGRMTLVRSAFPGGGWPDVSDGGLLDTLEEWLAPHLDGIRSAGKLAQLDVADLLKQRLDYRQQRELDELVPTHLVVPSGSRIRLDYAGEAPVLAVKLQELFGLAEGPTVCRGRVTVLLHLLSPAGRPIQVTRDLKGFWDGSYHQVKKELKGRYPKHPWPDDPWSALPTKRVKPRGV
ncbi:MAG: ATP-dependent helicase HrpB [Deltaproteobacteria bacterium]|nr:ATP-dependent helicase HrpB [Deltaproteobacteria bacterium]